MQEPVEWRNVCKNMVTFFRLSDWTVSNRSDCSVSEWSTQQYPQVGKYLKKFLAELISLVFVCLFFNFAFLVDIIEKNPTGTDVLEANIFYMWRVTIVADVCAQGLLQWEAIRSDREQQDTSTTTLLEFWSIVAILFRRRDFNQIRFNLITIVVSD